MPPLDSIRYDDPAVQRLCSVLEEAQTLTELLLAAWPLARVLALHIVESVLTERARRPTAWPRCPVCGTACREVALCQAPSHEPVGPICTGDDGSDGVRRGAASSRWPPWMRNRGLAAASAYERGAPISGLCLGRLCPVCHCGAVAGVAVVGDVVSSARGWCWVQAAGHQAMEYPPGGLACRSRRLRATARAADSRAGGLAVGPGR